MAHLLEVHFFEFGELFLRLAVVAEIVIAIAGALLFGDFKHGRGKSVHHEGDDACAVGLKRQPSHVQHELNLREELGLVGDVVWFRGLGRGFGFLLPITGDGKPLLQFTHGGEVLVEAALVSGPEAALETANVIAHHIEDAAALLETFQVSCHVFGVTLEEHFAKQGRRAVFSRQQHAVACPGQAAVRLVDVHAEVQRRKARLLAELFSRELVERDAVAESAASRITRGGEETILCAVAAGDRRV